MNKKPINYLPAISLLLIIFFSSHTTAQQRDLYQIKEYHISTPEQEKRLDRFFKEAYVPALHRAGIENVGVFKPVDEAEDAGKIIFMLIPFTDLDKLAELPTVLAQDDVFQKSGSDVLATSHDQPAYDRISSTLLKAFELMPQMAVPDFSNSPDERIYELRSYEAASEKLYRRKVEMFNEGGEIKIFEDLGFNAVFYGDVISGDHMPNLMYMTTFTDMDSRDQHWDAFRAAPAWEELKAQEYYANTVSHADTYLLHPTEYSDY